MEPSQGSRAMQDATPAARGAGGKGFQAETPRASAGGYSSKLDAPPLKPGFRDSELLGRHKASPRDRGASGPTLLLAFDGKHLDGASGDAYTFDNGVYRKLEGPFKWGLGTPTLAYDLRAPHTTMVRVELCKRAADGAPAACGAIEAHDFGAPFFNLSADIFRSTTDDGPSARTLYAHLRMDGDGALLDSAERSRAAVSGASELVRLLKCSGASNVVIVVMPHGPVGAAAAEVAEELSARLLAEGFHRATTYAHHAAPVSDNKEQLLPGTASTDIKALESEGGALRVAVTKAAALFAAAPEAFAPEIRRAEGVAERAEYFEMHRTGGKVATVDLVKVVAAEVRGAGAGLEDLLRRAVFCQLYQDTAPVAPVEDTELHKMLFDDPLTEELSGGVVTAKLLISLGSLEAEPPKETDAPKTRETVEAKKDVPEAEAETAAAAAALAEVSVSPAKPRRAKREKKRKLAETAVPTATGEAAGGGNDGAAASEGQAPKRVTRRSVALAAAAQAAAANAVAVAAEPAAPAAHAALAAGLALLPGPPVGAAAGANTGPAVDRGATYRGQPLKERKGADPGAYVTNAATHGRIPAAAEQQMKDTLSAGKRLAAAALLEARRQLMRRAVYARMGPVAAAGIPAFMEQCVRLAATLLARHGTLPDGASAVEVTGMYVREQGTGGGAQFRPDATILVPLPFGAAPPVAGSKEKGKVAVFHLSSNHKINFLRVDDA